MNCRFELTQMDETGVRLSCPALEMEARVGALTSGLFRVLIKPTGLSLPNSYTVARGAEDIPFEGVEREGREAWHWESTSGGCTVEDDRDQVILSTGKYRVRIQKEDFLLCWECLEGTEWLPLLRDRRTGAYNWKNRLGAGAFHYVDRLPGDMVFGLGEKAGDVVKNQGFYRMKSVDCMGYDAERSDPLYKHIPFYLVKGERGCCGVYYDTTAECTFDLGREMDNYHAPYRFFRSEESFLDYYVILGERMRDVVPEFSRLGGRTAFPPRWTLGYLASSMGYTDSENAQERLIELLERCRGEDVPVSGFLLSSGYTSINGKRYVFHWNEEKFPDVEGLAAHYAVAGVRLIANIKPCLLIDHPKYAQCREEGLLVRESDGSPAISPFWDESGSCLDFTNPDAYSWWTHQVGEQLLARGIAATWNDNNEFEIWDPNAVCHWGGEGRPTIEVRPVLTLLMLRASREAQREFAPNERPYLLTRSGCLGLQRYAQTWTGDNYTDWKTLRYNHKMGVGLSLSGIYNFGHDVGGFSGPRPGAELFVRWVQHGIFMPRFSIHSWNDDSTENEPWMYSEYAQTVRELIIFRYTLAPYLYHLLYRATTAYEPIVRPIFYNYDGAADWESDFYCLGDELLIANVFDPGVTVMNIPLPGKHGWYEWNGAYHVGGDTVHMAAELEDSVPIFVRAGSVVPYDPDVKGFSQQGGGRCSYRLYLPEEGTFEGEVFRDDGHSESYRQGEYELIHFEVSCLPDEVRVRVFNKTGAWFQRDIDVKVFDMRGRKIQIEAEGYIVRGERAGC